MGIKIRYLAPAAAGDAFAYSVERRKDETFFDFELNTFRPLGDIPAHAATGPLIRRNGVPTADFDYGKSDEMYIIRIHHVGQGGKIIAELPISAMGEEGPVSPSKGGKHMEPSYRLGKKYSGNEIIEAKHRLTFYGNDGFTIHTATLWADDTASCNCPGWRFRRTCKHSMRALNLTASIDETGERPVRSTSAAPEESPRGTNPFKRRTRSVDT